jgi:hypothetical protein
VVIVPPPTPGLGAVHTPLTHKPLAQSVAALQGDPVGCWLTTTPQIPFVQAPLVHSAALEQLAPSGSPEPEPHTPFAQVLLAQSALLVQVLPEGAPWPLPTQRPDWHTPLAQSVPVVHVPPAG